MKLQVICLVCLFILFMFSETYPQIIPDFKVSTNGYDPHIAVSTNGNFMITWISDESDSANVYARCFDKDGIEIGSTSKVNDDGVVTEWGHTVLSDYSGNFLITFLTCEGVIIQYYSNDGIKNESYFKFDAYGNVGCIDHGIEIPSVSSSGANNFVITWYSRHAEQYLEDQDYVYAQVFSNDGIVLGDTFIVNDPQYPLLDDRYDHPVVSSDIAGNFVVVWSDGRYGVNYNDGATLYAQRFTYDGTPLGSNFKVNETDHARRPRVSKDLSGNFVITYAYTSNGYEGVYGQRYTQDGISLGDYFKVNDDLSNSEEALVSIDMNSTFLITWVQNNNDEEIGYAQRYSSDGSKIGDKFENKGLGAKLWNGRIHNVWEVDRFGGGISNGIWANVLDFDNPLSVVEKDLFQHPSVNKISQNYPNPFNPVTKINYELPITNYVKIGIFNLLGQKVTTLVDEEQSAGYHQVEWDASGFAGGVYYYRLEAGEFVAARKMVLLR